MNAAVIDTIIAVLLVATLGYMFILNRRLSSLRSANSEMRKIIHEFVATVANAETAVTRMSSAGQEICTEINQTIDKAEQVKKDMIRVTRAGSQITETLDQRLGTLRTAEARNRVEQEAERIPLVQPTRNIRPAAQPLTPLERRAEEFSSPKILTRDQTEGEELGGESARKEFWETLRAMGKVGQS